MHRTPPRGRPGLARWLLAVPTGLALVACGAEPPAPPPAAPAPVAVAVAAAVPLADDGVVLPPGDHTLGSPPDEPGRAPREPQHRVRLRHPVWIGRTEVTQAEFQVRMGWNPSFFQAGAGAPAAADPPAGPTGPGLPRYAPVTPPEGAEPGGDPGAAAPPAAPGDGELVPVDVLFPDGGVEGTPTDAAAAPVEGTAAPAEAPPGPPVPPEDASRTPTVPYPEGPGDGPRSTGGADPESERPVAEECVDTQALEPSACGDRCPVEGVSWFDALAYANARSAAEGLPPCFTFAEVVCADGSPAADPAACQSAARGGIAAAVVGLTAGDTPLDCAGYRLPTEAEWEAAARAGAGGALPDGGALAAGGLGCGPADPALDPWAWTGGNAGGMPHPVGQKRANALGLHDVLGNVWEWVLDGGPTEPGAERSLLSAPDPAAPGGQVWVDPLPWHLLPKRMCRGGSWLTAGAAQRLASRDELPPGHRDAALGFRLARSVL